MTVAMAKSAVLAATCDFGTAAVDVRGPKAAAQKVLAIALEAVERRLGEFEQAVRQDELDRFRALANDRNLPSAKHVEQTPGDEGNA